MLTLNIICKQLQSMRIIRYSHVLCALIYLFSQIIDLQCTISLCHSGVWEHDVVHHLLYMYKFGRINTNISMCINEKLNDLNCLQIL